MSASRRNAAVMLLLFAIALPFVFFGRRVERYHCCFQYHSDVLTQGPADGLLFGFRYVFVVTRKSGTETVGYQALDGIYTRSGIPILIGWIGGALVPISAMVGAAVVLSRRPKNSN